MDINSKRQRASPSANFSDDDSGDLFVFAKDSQEEVYIVKDSQDEVCNARDSQDEVRNAKDSQDEVRNAEDSQDEIEDSGELSAEEPSARLGKNEVNSEFRGVPLALRLQELTGEVISKDTRPIARLPDNGMNFKSRGISLALRLQQLTGAVASSDARPSANFPKNELHLESRGIPLAVRFQELVQQGIQNDGVEDKMSEGLELQTTPSKEKSGSEDIDEIEESPIKDEDLQMRRPSKACTELAFGSGSLLFDRFREVLDSAPLDPDSTVVARHDSQQATSGFAAALQDVMKKLRSRQMRFEKATVQSKPLHGKSLFVRVLRKRLKAQLTICQCTILQSPEETDDISFVDITEREDMITPNTAHVIFSSKISPDLEVEIGGTIRIDPPWREINGPGTVGRTILNTYFCETVG